MPYDDDYVKQLEKENENLRRRMEVNATLADILKKYFLLSKKVNRRGEEFYGVTLTPGSFSHGLSKFDYDYLTSIGILEETDTGEAQRTEFVANDDPGIKEILDEFYKNVKLPKEYMKNM